VAGAGYCSSSRIHDFNVLPKPHIRDVSVTSLGAEELSGGDEGCDCGDVAGVCCCGCVEGC